MYNTTPVHFEGVVGSNHTNELYIAVEVYDCIVAVGATRTELCLSLLMTD